MLFFCLLMLHELQWPKLGNFESGHTSGGRFFGGFSSHNFIRLSATNNIKTVFFARDLIMQNLLLKRLKAKISRMDGFFALQIKKGKMLIKYFHFSVSQQSQKVSRSETDSIWLKISYRPYRVDGPYGMYKSTEFSFPYTGHHPFNFHHHLNCQVFGPQKLILLYLKLQN